MRRKHVVTIDDPGRDKGKTFILTEMPADIGERWAIQAMYLLAKAGVTVPDGVQEAGMAGLAATGVDFLSIAQLRALQDPSLDEQWDYVEYLHAPGHPPQKLVTGDGSQIEEIRTRSRLRQEVLKLHTDFFTADEPPTSDSSRPSPASPNTPTSPG